MTTYENTWDMAQRMSQERTMTEAEYLAVCEQACRNIFNRLEELELYAEPTPSELQHFRDQVKEQISGYQDALDAYCSRKEDT